jgi:hypothetical protein
MKKYGLVFAGITAVMLVAGLFAGCSPETVGGDGAELEAAREMIDNLEEQLNEAKDEAGALMQQIAELGDGAGLTGDTKEETAINIVQQYHKTHTYSMEDLYVCANMAMDVWNMLKAQGIDAVIQIGSAEKTVTNMVDSEHAWVIAEIDNGQYLALETTSGEAVTKAENPLYYTGWAVESPAKYNEFEELMQEHNVRADIVNSMIKDAENTYSLYQTEFGKYQAAVTAYNNDPTDAKLEDVMAKLGVAKELEGRYNELQALIAEQQDEMGKIPPKMQALTN